MLTTSTCRTLPEPKLGMIQWHYLNHDCKEMYQSFEMYLKKLHNAVDYVQKGNLKRLISLLKLAASKPIEHGGGPPYLKDSIEKSLDPAACAGALISWNVCRNKGKKQGSGGRGRLRKRERLESTEPDGTGRWGRGGPGSIEGYRGSGPWRWDEAPQIETLNFNPDRGERERSKEKGGFPLELIFPIKRKLKKKRQTSIYIPKNEQYLFFCPSKLKFKLTLMPFKKYSKKYFYLFILFCLSIMIIMISS